MQPVERRKAPRTPLGRVLLNKYIDGYPHAVTLLNLSPDGMLVRKVTEPDNPRDYYSIELTIPGQPETFWLWTRKVWEAADHQALKFMGVTPIQRARIKHIVELAHKAA